jgi:hypothetical protein
MITTSGYGPDSYKFADGKPLTLSTAVVSSPFASNTTFPRASSIAVPGKSILKARVILG